jgi:Zn-dependent peptidase ImmA (M78 family)
MNDTLIELLIAGDRTRGAAGPHLSTEFLDELLEFAARYARVEKLIFGGTRIAYSPSALALDLAVTGDVLAQAEALADAERARFDLPPGPILGIDRLVEDQGVKVIPREFPAGAVARGGFFFDSRLGACIFYDASVTPAQRDYIVAHQYGHFLADYDPYIHTICGHPGPEALDDAREVRAHQFALAFAMPAADLTTYREAIGIDADAAIDRDFIRQLQVYFGVDNEIVLWRLLSLGWVDAVAIRSLLAHGLLPEIDLEQIDADARLLLEKPTPERFIHLVASAFGRGKIEVTEAAELLDADTVEAQRVLGQFHYDDAVPADSAKGKKGSRRAGLPPSPN